MAQTLLEPNGMSLSNLVIVSSGYDHHSYSSFLIFVFTKLEQVTELMANTKSSCIQARNHSSNLCFENMSR